MTQRLDKALTQHYQEFSRSYIEKHIRAGHVSVNGVVCHRPGMRVDDADTLIINKILEKKPSHLVAQPMDLDIVFEDTDLIVVNKPAGLVVHPSPGHFSNTLVNGLLSHNLCKTGYDDRPGIIHRLDKDTSGLMVVVKNEQSYKALKKQFQERTLSREYTALVWGKPKPSTGIINRPISPHPRNRKYMRVLRSGGKEAITHYTLNETFGSLASKVCCHLKTGRTHQIRVHMANIGHGVLGDKLYGNPYQGQFTLSIKRHCLHAHRLSFVHPIQNKPLCFESSLPEDILETLRALQQIVSGTHVSPACY